MQRQPNPFTGEWETYIYKYEVQINQVNTKTIEGVTYSYKQKEFYGKAAFKGLFTKATKNVLLKETKMLELKTTDNTVPCLMTCYLDYSKNGNIEKLKGTFSSIESPGHKDCGGGSVTLQRVTTSDFKKENFLVKKTPAKLNNTLNKPKPVVKNNPAPTHNSKQKNMVEHKANAQPDIAVNKTKPIVKNTIPIKVPKKNIVQSKPALTKKTKEVANPPVNNKSSETIAATVSPNVPKKIIFDYPAPDIVAEAPVVVPPVLKSRTNKLVNTVIVNEKNITVDYYDNGEIDGDVISVYDNNRLVINHDTLSTKPLRLNICSDANSSIHELVTVAENLGTIPPNTCLMIITAGKQRFEIPMSSDEKTNAKVIIKYQPKEGTKIISYN